MNLRQQLAEADALLTLQRDVAERLLISALRESDAAEEARALAQNAAFLADVGGRLSDSLDEGVTERAIAGLRLPAAAEWCIVDLADDKMAMHRLTVIHRDPLSQSRLAGLAGHWSPRPGESFGVPAVLTDHTSVQIEAGAQAMLGTAHGNPDILRTLSELDIGALLTTPLIADGRVIGAITFVGQSRTRVFHARDIALAEGLARRSAIGLQQARTHTDAIMRRNEAEGEARISTAFLRSMSHELRTPLQAIAGYVELMDRGLHGPVTVAQRRDLERIMGSQRHLLTLINQLLDFIRSGIPSPSPIERVVIRDAILRACEIIEPLAADKGVLLRADLAPGQLLVLADSGKLQQILINLLANGVKFTPAGGAISVGARAHAGDVLIFVADTGRGIPEEMLDVVFEPFKQLQEADKALGGVGLGLSISRDLARSLQGDITASSVPGNGATFTLKLPASVA